ncbi:MAG: hypothetical protein HY796_12250 [Elusimicrobia bacterium]|nr:hypothetical protein [Elusimicrobiota bacterium]
MRLYYTKQWMKWSFILGFYISYVGFSIIFWSFPILIAAFFERLQDHYPDLYLLFDLDKSPLVASLIYGLGEKLPCLGSLFFLMAISMRIEVILMLIGGLIGLSLDFDQSPNFRNKEIQKIYRIQQQRDRKPINEKKWIKCSFIGGFCLHSIIFLWLYLSELYMVKIRQIHPDYITTSLIKFYGDLGLFGILLIPPLYGVIGGILLTFVSALAALWFNFLDRLEQLCLKAKTDTTEQG